MRSTIILLLLTGCASTNQTLVEFGPTQISSDRHTGEMVTITERFDRKYDVTFGWISDQEWNQCGRPDCQWYIDRQLVVGVERVFPLRFIDESVRLSLGPYVFQNPDRISPTYLRAGVSLEWQITDRIGLRARHWSNAGTARVTCVRHSFDPYKHPELFEYKTCNDWNTGQDSWLRLVIYF